MRQEHALRRSAESAAEARRALAGVADRIAPQRLEDARLLVSELVTNAVRHAGLAGTDVITLVLDAGDRRLRIEVRDPGLGFVPAEPAAPGEMTPARAGDPVRPSGWGLYLVGKLSDRWGVERDAGTVVWFELDRDAA